MYVVQFWVLPISNVMIYKRTQHQTIQIAWNNFQNWLDFQWNCYNLSALIEIIFQINTIP